jgi:hypothetical protein
VDTLTAVAEAAPIGIPVEHRDAASRYIAAIVASDARASADPRFAALRTRQLWEQFGREHAAVATGPYARHGQAALRIALGKL